MRKWTVVFILLICAVFIAPLCNVNAVSEEVSYSSSDLKTTKQGDSGVLSYKSLGLLYDIYYIIDFDEGFVYYFTVGDGSGTCDKVKIDSGNLNSVLIITYHIDNEEWSYGLRFNWRNQPDHLIVQDEDGFEYSFYPTDLEDALEIKNGLRIVDY